MVRWINLVSLNVLATEGDLVSLKARAFNERREKSTGSDKLRASDLVMLDLRKRWFGYNWKKISTWDSGHPACDSRQRCHCQKYFLHRLSCSPSLNHPSCPERFSQPPWQLVYEHFSQGGRRMHGGEGVATALPQVCSAAAPFPLLTWQQRPCWTNIACSPRSSSPSFSLSSSLPSLLLSSWLSQSQTIAAKKALLDKHGMKALICAPCVFVQHMEKKGRHILLKYKCVS